MEGAAATPAAVHAWQPPDLAPQQPLRPPPSVAEIAAIEAAAREEGFTRGYTDGIAQGQTEVRRHIAQLAGLIDSFARPVAQLDDEVVHALSGLALRIARALVGDAYRADAALLAALVAESLALAGDEVRGAEVRMHPDDLATVEPMLALADLPRARLVGDAGLGRGDVRVHTDSLRIDGSLETRLQSVLDSLRATGDA